MVQDTGQVMSWKMVRGMIDTSRVMSRFMGGVLVWFMGWGMIRDVGQDP